jgi:hypothetical protein
LLGTDRQRDVYAQGLLKTKYLPITQAVDPVCFIKSDKLISKMPLLLKGIIMFFLYHSVSD